MITKEFVLDPYDNQYLAMLSGHLEENFRLLEKRLGVEINNRANVFKIIGEAEHVQTTLEILQNLYQEIEDNKCLTVEKLHLLIQSGCQKLSQLSTHKQSDIVITTKKGLIRPRGINQQNYVENILSSDVTFGIGPAGTGKTYLAVAAAVDSLERQEIRRILLTRPAVEAGEKLGFLPGDLNQKVDPYLRPLYDALYEMLGFEKVGKLIERNVIEVAPLAYM